MKMTYKQQISKLEEEEKEYKDKYSNNEKQIKDLKENIYLVEKMMKIDPLKIKTFDYSKIKEELFEDDWRKNRKIVKELQEIKETVVPIKNETQEN